MADGTKQLVGPMLYRRCCDIRLRGSFMGLAQAVWTCLKITNLELPNLNIKLIEAELCIYASVKYTIIGTDNRLLSDRRQAII